MITRTHKQAGFALAGIAAAALGAAFIAQYMFGLAPCHLCIYQRIPYAIIIVLGLIAGFGPNKFAPVHLLVIAIALAIEFGLATFHVGVEQKWWEGFDSCSISLEGLNAEQIREQILGAPRALCGDVAWSLFGISMAGYNALLSFGLLVLTAFHLGAKPPQLRSPQSPRSGT